MTREILSKLETAALHLDFFLTAFPGALGSEKTVLLAADELAEAMTLLHTSIPPAKTWEVQTHTACDGWINCWTVHHEDGSSQVETFDTREAASAAAEEFFSEIEEEITLGIREPDEGYSREDLRIAQVQP